MLLKSINIFLTQLENWMKKPTTLWSWFLLKKKKELIKRKELSLSVSFVGSIKWWQDVYSNIHQFTFKPNWFHFNLCGTMVFSHVFSISKNNQKANKFWYKIKELLHIDVCKILQLMLSRNKLHLLKAIQYYVHSIKNWSWQYLSWYYSPVSELRINQLNPLKRSVLGYNSKLHLIAPVLELWVVWRTPSW